MIKQKVDKSAFGVATGSASYVRIWNADDGGESFVHLVSSGNDYTICGHDFAGDEDIHARPPQMLPGRHRVTCAQCLGTIADVRDHLRKPNDQDQQRRAPGINSCKTTNRKTDSL